MIIALEGMKFWAKIGFYEEEQILGNDIRVDIYVNTSNESVDRTDDLGQTLNYETIYQLCRIEMKKPAKLLETIAINIHKRIHNQFQENIIDVTVRVSKMNPPLNGPVERAFIQING